MAVPTWDPAKTVLLEFDGTTYITDVPMVTLVPWKDDKAVAFFNTSVYGGSGEFPPPTQTQIVWGQVLTPGAPPTATAKSKLWSSDDSVMFGTRGAYDHLSAVRVGGTDRYLLSFATTTLTIPGESEQFLVLVEVGDTGVTVISSVTEPYTPKAILAPRLVRGATDNTFVYVNPTSYDPTHATDSWQGRIVTITGDVISMNAPVPVPTVTSGPFVHNDAYGGLWCDGTVGVLIPAAMIEWVPFTVTPTTITFGTPVTPDTTIWPGGDPTTYENLIADGPGPAQFVVHVYNEDGMSPDFIKLAAFETDGTDITLVDITPLGHYDDGGVYSGDYAWSPRTVLPTGELVSVFTTFESQLTLGFDGFGTETQVPAPIDPDGPGAGAFAVYTPDTGWDRSICATPNGFWVTVCQYVPSSDTESMALVATWFGPDPGPSESVNKVFELGCGTTRVIITDRTGGLQIADLTADMSSAEYGRMMDDSSEASITVPLTGGAAGACCEKVGGLRTWLHTGVIYRNNELVWGPGPLINIRENRGNAVIRIRDVTAWLDRRLIHTDHAFTQTDIIQIAVTIITEAMAPDDPCDVIGNLQVLGVGQLIDYQVDAHRKYAGEILRDLARIGLDFTVIGTSILLAPTLSFGPITSLMDGDFLVDIEVEERGEDTATKWTVIGAAVDGSCGDIDPYYGLIEQLATEDDVTDSDSADIAACNRLSASNPAPLFVNIPSDAQLSSKAPVNFEHLVPGLLLPVNLNETCRKVAVTNRLTAVKVTAAGGDEQVKVTLAPLGTNANDGTGSGF